jgi:predicted naringenin-chalcone synthase
MSVIAGAHAVVGPYGYSQGEITEAFTAVMSPQGAEEKIIKRILSATGNGQSCKNLRIIASPLFLLNQFPRLAN